jgi:Family of unknown function (DUF5519)
MPLTAWLTRVATLPPSRLGRRPHMQRILPHLQVDQLPSAEVMDELVRRSREIPIVLTRESRMASPQSFALALSDKFALGPPEAFIDRHEFCHLHPMPECGIHLTLPRLLRDEVVRLGWGERHPVAEACILPALLTIYAPRNRDEVEIVLALVLQSCSFAQGKLQALRGEDLNVPVTQ